MKTDPKLEPLLNAIEAHGPITARALAKKLGRAKVTVHRLLERLPRWRGKKKLVRTKVRDGATGPLATAYRLVRG